MDTQEKSILTQATFDQPSTLPNRSSILDDSSLPIHYGDSFIMQKSKASKNCAFGSKANRITYEISPNKSSEIVAYQSIFTPKHQYSSTSLIKSKPFGVGGERFKFQRNWIPGPGKYEVTNQQILPRARSSDVIISPVGRQNQFSMKETTLGPGTYNVQLNAFQQLKKKLVANKIRQKCRLNREKLQEQMQKLKKRQIITPLAKPKEAQHKQSQSKLNKIPQKLLAQQQLERYKLKQSTKKYLPALIQRHRCIQYRSSIGSSANFMPPFIDKNDYAYSSYIVKDENPGPGTYANKETSTKPTISAAFKSSSKRTLFDIKNIEQPKKKKVQWSYFI